MALRVDGEVLKLLDETQETVQLYERLETERGGLLLEFAMLYLGFALIVILASVWFGLWFAEQLAGQGTVLHLPDGFPQVTGEYRLPVLVATTHGGGLLQGKLLPDTVEARGQGGGRGCRGR